jgi:hypothetical protein
MLAIDFDGAVWLLGMDAERIAHEQAAARRG